MVLLLQQWPIPAPSTPLCGGTHSLSSSLSLRTPLPPQISLQIWYTLNHLCLSERACEFVHLRESLSLCFFIQAKKLKDNHSWFVDTLSRFKPPSQKSKEALTSKKLKIGSHELTIQPQLKDKALQISSYLVSCLLMLSSSCYIFVWIINYEVEHLSCLWRVKLCF